MYKESTDEIKVRNFLSKDKILELIDEDSIFELVFGHKPEEHEYTTSPFRDDKSPGCYFEYSTSGRLKFVDWASDYYVNNTKMVSMDCFDAVKIYYNLPNFYQTLLFVYNHLIKGEELTARPSKNLKERIEKIETDILIETREFNHIDANYWNKYKISSQNLKDDKVFAVRKFRINSNKSSGKITYPYKPTYAYTDFNSNKKKLYCPTGSKKFKFITNCGKNDIGGVSSLSHTKDNLIITKSYKDCRVIKNQGYDVVWFQNEGMFPDIFILLQVVSGYKEIIVFFDNDRAGIEASSKLVEYLTPLGLKVRDIFLPDLSIKDPSDLVHYKSEEDLVQFLNAKI